MLLSQKIQSSPRMYSFFWVHGPSKKASQHLGETWTSSKCRMNPRMSRQGARSKLQECLLTNSSSREFRVIGQERNGKGFHGLESVGASLVACSGLQRARIQMECDESNTDSDDHTAHKRRQEHCPWLSNLHYSKWGAHDALGSGRWVPDKAFWFLTHNESGIGKPQSGYGKIEKSFWCAKPRRDKERSLCQRKISELVL